ncbi:lipase family protein [Ralstonia sp. 24A2]|uniref:lipase family protein n=1 Tax=Ralstonia sp. 24A2 TaxID=3447364 RepID=UPI003F697986
MGTHQSRAMRCLLTVAVLLACQAKAQRHPASEFLLPEREPDDVFYRVSPEDLSGEHGHLIRSRPANPTAGLEHAERSELLIYQSAKNDGKDTARAVSGIVAIPKGPTPRGGWPIVSWAHGTVGSADRCAPSMDSDLLGLPELHRKINRAPHVMLNAFLKAGWAVVMTDYEGLGTAGPHPYLNGPSEGRGVLDIVRATHEYGATHGIEFSEKFAVVGHSQGGHAALWAAHLQEGANKWIPEKLVGVAAIAPAPNPYFLQFLPSNAAQDPTKEPSLPFLPLAILGAQRGDPDISLTNILTPEGLNVFKSSVDSYCRVELSGSELWGKNPDSLFNKPFPNLIPPILPWPKLGAQLNEMDPNQKVDVPIRISQASEDERVPVTATRPLVAQLENKNGKSSVCYKEYGKLPTPKHEGYIDVHFQTITADTKAMVDWLRIKFDGKGQEDCPDMSSVNTNQSRPGLVSLR